MNKSRVIVVFYVLFTLICGLLFAAPNNALAQALYLGDFELAEQLLIEGADIDATYYSSSPIEIAVDEGEIDFATILLEAGADIRGTNLLGQAIYDGEIEFAQKLIEAGVDINTTYYGYTPLEWAIRLGDHNLVKKLQSLAD